MNRHLKSEQGMAALIALLMVGMLTLIGLAALTTSDDEVSIAGNQFQETKAFYAAESGLDRAVAQIQAHYEATNRPPDTLPEGENNVNLCSVSYGTHSLGPDTNEVLSAGAMEGLHARVHSFAVQSTGTSPADHAKVVLSETFKTALIPLFQFAVFYGNDLEIAPGADMTLMGRVHSNGNLWIQAGTTLKMDSYVTSSGNILHGRKGAGSVANGDVQIKNAAGTYTSMKEGASGWLEATDSYWYDSAVARWNGRVQDHAFGQKDLPIPIAGGGNPHKLIEPQTGNPDSYENKATLKFIDNKAYKLMSGVWSDVTGAMQAAGIISRTENKFRDGRENKDADVTELNMGTLYSFGGGMYAPENGVIYFSDATGGSDFPALRINNAATLTPPAGKEQGLTIASKNPVYTLGDFNKTNKKPAAIMADALTFLSTKWANPANAYDTKGGLACSNRPADNTTVNVSYLTGNVNTTSTNYNGGFENLPRFLEDWNTKTFTWKGSAVNLWNSQQANSIWKDPASTGYYRAPTRAWSYDTDLDNPANLPPETPVARIFERTGWRQEYVGTIRDSSVAAVGQ